MARFEVLGLDADRDLIRSLAKRLAEDDPEATRIRAAVHLTIAGEPPKKGGISRSQPHPFARNRPQGRPVTGYLLDTNIISNVTCGDASAHKQRMVNHQANSSFTTG